MRVRTVLTVALVGLALLLAVGGTAQAKGPRASLASWTACALDLVENRGGATLVVTTTLTNKSSGGRIAEVRGGTSDCTAVGDPYECCTGLEEGTCGESAIAGTYKPVGRPGGHTVNVEFDSHDIGFLGDVGPEGTIITEKFDICDVFELARDLNGMATVKYGLSGGGGETRTVMNRCSDDPDTDAADCTAEGDPYDCCSGAGTGTCDEGAIRVADYFDLIDDACP